MIVEILCVVVILVAVFVVFKLAERDHIFVSKTTIRHYCELASNNYIDETRFVNQLRYIIDCYRQYPGYRSLQTMLDHIIRCIDDFDDCKFSYNQLVSMINSIVK